MRNEFQIRKIWVQLPVLPLIRPQSLENITSLGSRFLSLKPRWGGWIVSQAPCPTLTLSASVSHQGW